MKTGKATVMTPELNVDLAITDQNQVVLYLEEPVPDHLSKIVYHRHDGYVTLVFAHRQHPITLEHPIAPDLRPPFEAAGKAAIGHVADNGLLTAQYAVSIKLSDRPGKHTVLPTNRH